MFVVSNEPDETAGTKQICIRNSRDSKEDYYIVMIDEGVFKCHDKRINNNDHRTQIRQLNYAGYTALITKKPTNLKEKLMERSATPTEPGTILIEIGNTKLTFLGFNNNRGIVKVEST